MPSTYFFHLDTSSTYFSTYSFQLLLQLTYSEYIFDLLLPPTLATYSFHLLIPPTPSKYYISRAHSSYSSQILRLSFRLELILPWQGSSLFHLLFALTFSATPCTYCFFLPFLPPTPSTYNADFHGCEGGSSSTGSGSGGGCGEAGNGYNYKW